MSEEILFRWEVQASHHNRMQQVMVFCKWRRGSISYYVYLFLRY